MATPTKPDITLDPRTYARGLSCVHCGLCLPACPTYTETGNEADSPRGRIQLMLAMADGRIRATKDAVEHLDLCLDCRACEPACPSGVVYHELIEETRVKLEQRSDSIESDSKNKDRKTIVDRFLRLMFFHIFTHPTRLKLALLPARLLQRIGLWKVFNSIGLFNILGPKLGKLQQMLPSQGQLWPPAPREKYGTGTKRVGFLTGCIGSVMYEPVNRRAIELLVACGAEVLVPKSQKCCAAIHHHNAAEHEAQRFARANIDAFLPKDSAQPVDWIVSTIGGCGAQLRDYGTLLRDDPNYAERAKIFAWKVRDISEVLLELGMPANLHRVEETVTYHDACHLAHAQRVTVAPRALLAKVPGLKLIPLPESDMCCGAAGTYNLTQPEMATKLARRKLDNIALTKCSTCVTGNAGCSMHISSEADRLDRKLTVVHPVDILHRAVFGN
ncbi:MAG TPA: heterodisulfide reductase-related iron-sulfur binding cluster [Tepidisphaeraceae bacterium]|nr:heterodisulfide reductase-related iron-sulfur binding cluster [Tepidisphaeraceae bacterium]